MVQDSVILVNCLEASSKNVGWSRMVGIFSERSMHATPLRAPINGEMPTLLQHRRMGWTLGLPDYVTVPEGNLPTIIAIGGGKGGVGKSVISANLAAKLALSGQRVVAIDIDLGCANLHTHFGTAMPEKSLADFVVYGRKSFAEVLLPTPVHGLAFAAGGREEAWADQLEKGPQGLKGLFEVVLRLRQQMQVDVVVLDLGAGTHRHTMDFFAAAHMGIVTVLPEPTSIENAYVFIKAMMYSLIDHVARRTGEELAAIEIKSRLATLGGAAFGDGYLEAIRRCTNEFPEFVNAFWAALGGRSLGLIVNQTRNQSDIDIGTAMEHICKRYFGFETAYLGFLNYDDAVWKSLRNRRMLVNDFPHCVLSKRMGAIAARALQKLGY